MAGAALAPAPAAMGAPEPSIVPSRWQLDFRPGDLRLAVMDVETTRRGPGGETYTTTQPKAFLYLTYEVVNNSGEDLLFAPSFELATEEGEILRSGRNVPTEVVRGLLERLENPFLEDEISVIRTLEQGVENAREGLVVWPAEDLKTDEIKIFARGFSGETKRIVRPDTGEEVTLYKEMMLRHATPGDLATYRNRPIPRVESRWILR
jgi:hypothetical protein